jgi:prophage antirepressor-like protein
MKNRKIIVPEIGKVACQSVEENISIENDNEVINYNMKNVPELRLICKERNLANAHLKKKDELVKLLEDNPLNTVHDDIESVDYSKFNSRELKNFAKTRKLTNYNNLKKDELIKLHKDYDEDVKMIEEKNEDHDISVKDEEQIIISIGSTLNKIFKFEDKEIRTSGTSENPLFVVKDIADILDLASYRIIYNKMDDYMKGVCKIYTPGGLQEMQVINESGLYYMIMRSNKPNAKLFQRKVYEDILPSIRKTGSYKLEDKYKFIIENNRPLSQVMNNTDIDKEAIDIEKIYNWSKNSNCAIIYIAYIGDGLVKIGFSDSKFDERLCKHISCESKYKQFVILETFEVSGKPVEDQIHNLLNHYRFSFERQKEIYKPTSCLKNFIKNIEELINDNDYKLKYNRLLEKHNELEKKYLMLQLG